MKIACLLSVSEYESCPQLPACTNDAKAMHTLVDSSGEYEHILIANGNASGAMVKQQIVEFFETFSGKEVDQVLFYFSGHGDFDGTDFQYILKDYDPKKKKQTVLENAELDSWIRQLNPNITIKLVDACHSGIQYIKDPSAFHDSIAKSKESFKSCYFMFSSQRDQFSYQDQCISDFTRSLISSVAEYPGREMRFKDIIDYVSDEFSDNKDQTPFFVIQAKNTEKFASVSPELKEKLKSILAFPRAQNSATLARSSDTAHETPTLTSKVIADAKRFCSFGDVLMILDDIKEYTNKYSFDDLILSVYNFSCEEIAEISTKIPKTDAIGKWLSENKEGYFASPVLQNEDYQTEVQVPIRGNPMLGVFGQEYETKTVTKTRKIISSYRLNDDYKFSALKFSATPKFPNLLLNECFTAFVVSKTHIRFFYINGILRDYSFDKTIRETDSAWKSIQASLRDQKEIHESIDSIVLAFVDSIMNQLRSKFGPDEETTASE